MSAFPKLLTAAVAAAFLTVTPVHAQSTSVGGGGAEVYPSQELDQRVTPEHRMRMGETLRGLNVAPLTEITIDPRIGAVVPETAVRHPVPAEIIAVVPETQGYEYFVLPDGRIVLVHPEDNTIAMILD